MVYYQEGNWQIWKYTFLRQNQRSRCILWVGNGTLLKMKRQKIAYKSKMKSVRNIQYIWRSCKKHNWRRNETVHWVSKGYCMKQTNKNEVNQLNDKWREKCIFLMSYYHADQKLRPRRAIIECKQARDTLTYTCACIKKMMYVVKLPVNARKNVWKIGKSYR